MSNSTLTQEKAKIQEIINSYNEQRTSAKKEIKEIDEKYRKLAEAEKAALNATVSFYESAIDALTNLIGFEAASEALDKKEPSADASDDVVVDNLFPENNPKEVKEEEEPLEVVENLPEEEEQVAEEDIPASDTDNQGEGSETWPEKVEDWI